MHVHLRAYIDGHCDRHPAALLQLAEFIRGFREFIPAKSRESWSRGRIIAELSHAGFPIGVQHKIAMIGGLAMRGEWVERDGRLMMAAR